MNEMAIRCTHCHRWFGRHRPFCKVVNPIGWIKRRTMPNGVVLEPFDRIRHHVNTRIVSGIISVATGLVQIVTLGFVCPRWQLDWAFGVAHTEHRRHKAREALGQHLSEQGETK